MKDIDNKAISRIIDANVNRAKEGLRVCEEIVRFKFSDAGLSAQFKKVRHDIDISLRKFCPRICLIKDRDSLNDAGFSTNFRKEFKREGFKDIFFANAQRAKESIRVLEEFSKIKCARSAALFKKIRYNIYDLEKKAARIYKFR